ncbi:glucose-induced degradation protein [Trifolium repens]|nr:glucose-induced degradation protein [Trifolium repens]
MSVVSDSSPDSVENEKDFSRPTKKSKVYKDDLVGEEHNTDSVTSLSNRDIFDIWCKFFRVTYKDKEEELYKFGIFQKAIKLDKTEDELHRNFPALADHSEEELQGNCCAYITKSYVDYMMQFLAYLDYQSEEELEMEIPEDDIRRWTKFESFGPLLGQVEMDGGMSADLSNYSYIFMNPDPLERRATVCGAISMHNKGTRTRDLMLLDHFKISEINSGAVGGSSSFAFCGCLHSGSVILLLSSAITLISENVFLDQDNFWPTFVIHFSVGLACFICDIVEDDELLVSFLLQDSMCPKLTT